METCSNEKQTLFLRVVSFFFKARPRSGKVEFVDEDGARYVWECVPPPAVAYAVFDSRSNGVEVCVVGRVREAYSYFSRSKIKTLLDVESCSLCGTPPGAEAFDGRVCD